MNDCIFCKLSKNELKTDKIYEDEKVYVIRDISPKAPEHLLVIPHKHIEMLSQLDHTDQALMGHIMTSLNHYAKRVNLKDFRVIINNGKGAGQEVFHLHIHLLGGASQLPGF